MTKINVKEAKKHVAILSKLLDSYKENHKTIEYGYNNMMKYWKDNKYPEFFGLVNNNQLVNIYNIARLENSIKTLSRVIEKYSDIGNNIEYDPNKEDYIIQKFDNLSDKINKAIIKYNEFGNTSSYDKNNKIIDTKKNITKVKTNIENIQDKIKEKYKQTGLIEKDLNSILTKEEFDNVLTNQLDYNSKYKIGGRIIFDEIEIAILNKKNKVYFDDQKELINKLELNFDELIKYCISNLFTSINEYNNGIINQLKTVNKTNENLYNDLSNYCEETTNMVRENIERLEG